MSADRTADPSATASASALLAALWGNAQSNQRYSGAQVGPHDVGPWWHTADADFAEFDQYGKTPSCGVPMILSCGIGFLSYNPGYVFGNPATGTSEFDTSGNADHVWTELHAKWVAHHAAGGIVKMMDVGYNPAAYQAGSTTTGGVTVASVNASGVLNVGNLVPFNTYPFGGSTTLPGCGTIACSDGVHYFTWTGCTATSGAGNLTGVVIETTQRVTGTSGATIGAGAVVTPAALATDAGALSGAALSNAWPLQWSSTAYLALNADNPGLALTDGFTSTASLSVNANYNLNRYLDYLSVELAALAAAGVPVIFRIWPEPNFGGWWYSSTLTSWYPQLWKYTVAYLTGNPNDPSTGNPIGFAGQPVAGATGVAGAGAVHNVLYLFAMSYGNGFTGVNSPAGSLVDLIGLDTYTATPTAIHTHLNSMQGYPGMSNKPGGCAELYTHGNVYNARGVCTSTADLSTATTVVVNDAWYPTVGFGAVPSTNNPAFPTGGGSVMVPTTNGIQQMTYTSCSHAAAVVTDPDGIVLGQTTFVGCTTSAPSGSHMVQGGMVTQVDTGAGAPSAAATALATQISAGSSAKYPAFFVFWDGSSGATASELYVPGLSGLMGASGVVNRPTASAPGDWSEFGFSEWSFV